jgi:hypothetical protein
MSRTKVPSPSTAGRAGQLARLLVSADPAHVQARASHATNHFERMRQGRSRTHAPHSTPEGSPRTYLYDSPTCSPVLNAFLHELGAAGSTPLQVAVYDEHTLAPRLIECARRHMPSMLVVAGGAETAMVFAEQFPSITNERAARMYLRQAARITGELGAIARDYESHRGQVGAQEQDDRLASCIMAAFAGRILAYMERRLGPHVRENVRAELEQLASKAQAPVRRRAARTIQTPGGSGEAQDHTDPASAKG